MTGPPGTGKSQVIVAVVTSMLAEGKSVLFASRNHQAIDAVEERFHELLGERAILTRAFDRTGERNFDFKKAIDSILSESSTLETPNALAVPLRAVRDGDQRRRNALDDSRERARLGLALSEVADRLEALAASSAGNSTRQSGPLIRLLEWIREWFRRKPLPSAAVPRAGATRTELELAREHLTAMFTKLTASVQDPAVDDPGALTESIAKQVAELLPSLVEAKSKPSPDARTRLRNSQQEIALAIERGNNTHALCTGARGTRLPTSVGCQHPRCATEDPASTGVI